MKLYLEHQLGAVVAARDADRTVNRRDRVEGGEYCKPINDFLKKMIENVINTVVVS